jgi:hypothetical protein
VAKQFSEVAKGGISKARTVVAYAPDLAGNVLSGSKPLELGLGDVGDTDRLLHLPLGHACVGDGLLPRRQFGAGAYPEFDHLRPRLPRL